MIKIIAVSGKIGSGKDTTVGIIVRLLKDKGYNPVVMAFADPIKQAVAFLRDEEIGLFYSREGKDGNGKDTSDVRRKCIVAMGEAMTSVDPFIFANKTINKFVAEHGKETKTILVISDLRKRPELTRIERKSNHFTIRLKGSFEPTKNEQLSRSLIECDLDYLEDSPANYNIEGTPIYLDKSLAVYKPRCTKEDQLDENQCRINRIHNVDIVERIIDHALDKMF